MIPSDMNNLCSFIPKLEELNILENKFNNTEYYLIALSYEWFLNVFICYQFMYFIARIFILVQ